MSARSRVVAIVALAAVAAASAVVGITLLQTRGESTAVPGAVTKPRAGSPPLELELGLRDDAEARALATAERLYNRGESAQAGPIFARYRSLEAEIGSAFVAWPKGGGLDALKRLVASHPDSALAELHLGWAYYWAGRNADAIAAWEKTVQLEPDTPYAVDAEDVLHPTMAIPGLPPIVTGLSAPAAVAKLPLRAQLDALGRAAARPDAAAKLVYGLALWNLKRPLSAERQLAQAAALAPRDPVARTAAAVGRFSKADPVAAFSRLGPLTGVFPRAPVVRFHLGLLLIWAHAPGWRTKAATQLRLAIADGPQTLYAKEAKVLLRSLVNNGTS